MNTLKHPENSKEYLANPKIMENQKLLQEIGIINYIDSLDHEIQNYRSLLTGALDVVNRTTISEIMEALVRQISDYYKPTYITFLWKPLQIREDITIRCYKNCELVDTNLRIDSINAFEPFFQKHPKPVYHRQLLAEMGSCDAIKALDSIEPEMIIPILGPLGLYGMVLVGHSLLKDGHARVKFEYIQNLMAFFSQTIQNHLHYERTLRDGKTGLFNNCFFMTRLNEEVARTKRTKIGASIIMMDVDKFKNFNDTYGHIAGDKVLETLAITIKRGVRTEDVPSRFGGEEFTVLLPDTDKDPAFLVAERLRNMVADMKVVWEPSLPQATISLGIFTFDRETFLSAEEIVKRADEALYESKRRGRNCTTVWEPGLPGET